MQADYCPEEEEQEKSIVFKGKTPIVSSEHNDHYHCNQSKRGDPQETLRIWRLGHLYEVIGRTLEPHLRCQPFLSGPPFQLYAVLRSW